MKKFEGLTSQDMEHLAGMIEASLKIQKRSQLFLWAQGALQAFIAHETLLCAYGDVQHLRLRFEFVSSSLPDAQAEREVGDPVNGLLPRIAGDWLRAGCVPKLFHHPTGTGAGGSPKAAAAAVVPAELRRHGFGHMAAHGAKEIRGEFGSFFIFLGLPHSPGLRETYMLELLMPYLHMALYRMLAHENGRAARPAADAAGKTVLTVHQVRVLKWVKLGKTNQEIAQILEVSPNTVKNHMQKILRKLQVSNRAQAVGKGAALHLFSVADLG